MDTFVRTEFNYDMNAASVESGLECKDVSLTKQSFAEEVDINTIIRRFKVNGELPTGVRMPTYGDFTEVGDFKSAMDAVALANEAFDAMPAEVRKRFNNDPQAFVAFCSDARNMEEARRLGLVPAAEVVKAAAVVADRQDRRTQDGRYRDDTKAEDEADKVAAVAAGTVST